MRSLRLLRFPLVCGVAALLLTGCAQFGNSELEFTPSSFPECEGPNIVVDVSWDATSRTQAPIHIMVYKPGEPPKWWIQGPPKGHQETSKWMSDGTTMQLRNVHGELLAERTLETVPCAQSADKSED